MGYLLKEALKTLCGVNQWSYAVFWKIGCQNPNLLIWEECYYESMPCSALPCISGVESLELGFEEWEACWAPAENRTPQVGVGAEDKVLSLINKMMMDNRVKVVGQGLVGRAAFSGTHLWILPEHCVRETHPPEVQKEMCQQFLAGIKTVAVIPVLTHGVVQLGSSLAILENMAVVNDVKSLILQLACVPGVLLSDNYKSKDPAPKIEVPVFLENSVLSDSSGNHEMKDHVPSVADSSNRQNIPPQALDLVVQSTRSIIRNRQNNQQDTSSTFQIPKLAQNVVRSQGDPYQPNLLPVVKPRLPFNSQLENEETRAEVISLNPELWLNQQASIHNCRSGFDGQPYIGQSSASCSNLRIIEEQFLSDAALQEHVSDSLNTSGGNIKSNLRTNRSSSSSGGPLISGAGNHQGSILNPRSLPAVHGSARVAVPYAHVSGSAVNTGSTKTEALSSDLTDHLTSNHLLMGSTDFGHHSEIDKIEVARRQERTENDLSQALDIPLAQIDEHTKLREKISYFGHDTQNHDCKYQIPRSKIAKNENEFVQYSSGDDLFDILGVDFKNKLLNDGWNNFLNGEPDIHTKAMNKNNVSSSNLWDTDCDFYLVNGGTSDSGIFCGTGTDHLLDAVVNRVHTAAKQSSDDSVSCKTTLTKTSSSSVPNVSSSYGQVSVSDQKQGELSRLPKSLAKLAALGSCSFKSECSKEDAGNYSQNSSIFGSQISSWVEQGLDMKHSGSASTAYSKRPDDGSKSNRKRLKPGENPRPRPKDRQMIQDRMKELREIVPNGGKCSIDALLERTIKHMLFLQSVMKHADKLKQTEESKIVNKDGGLLMKENFEGGRTWAYEVGSQSMVCPIIVEDLNPPRQMLVEMLCEERGLFLEIADIIRGLGLTILKGVMETRGDKVWACFAVEANRDVTRMEIFISLVHLLEQTVKGNAASGNGIENDNVMVQHHTFHQTASIPATGI